MKENRCTCCYCNIKDQIKELHRVIDGIEREICSELEKSSDVIYKQEHFMDHEF